MHLSTPILTGALLFVLPLSSLAQSSTLANSCPFGQVNCTGQCGRFIDENGDGYCDHGAVTSDAASRTLAESRTEEKRMQQTFKEFATENGITPAALIAEVQRYYQLPAVGESDVIGLFHDRHGVCFDDLNGMVVAIKAGKPYERPAGELSGSELKTMTVGQAAAAYKIDATKFAQAIGAEYSLTVTPGDLLGNLADSSAVEMHQVKVLAQALRADASSTASITSSSPVPPQRESNAERYKFYELSFVMLLLYGTTLLLRHFRVMSRFAFNGVWNTVLLFAIIASGLLGMLLAAGIRLTLPFSMLYVHVVAGIILTWACLFHVIEYRGFYICMIKKGCKKRAAAENGHHD